MIKRGKWGDKPLFISNLIIGALMLFVPFKLVYPSSINTLVDTIFSISRSGYTPPVCYSFNGLSSSASYIHKHLNKDMMHPVENWCISAVILIVMSLIPYCGYKDLSNCLL